MKLSPFITAIFHNMVDSSKQPPTTPDWDTLLKNYVYDTISLPKDDYIAKIMRETQIFKQDTIPNLPIIWNHDITEPRMHYKTLGLLLLLHKLNIRPRV